MRYHQYFPYNSGTRFFTRECIRNYAKLPETHVSPLVTVPWKVQYIAGRIGLSHVHASTSQRTWSTQKPIFTGLASGGIIKLEYMHNSFTVSDEDLKL